VVDIAETIEAKVLWDAESVDRISSGMARKALDVFILAICVMFERGVRPFLLS
jgi:hypothetical protein